MSSICIESRKVFKLNVSYLPVEANSKVTPKSLGCTWYSNPLNCWVGDVFTILSIRNLKKGTLSIRGLIKGAKTLLAVIKSFDSFLI